MLKFFDPLRTMTVLSVLVRLALTFVCGGLIGMEREKHRRPAGLRTHILICLGAAMASLTSEYLLLYAHYTLDISRIASGVVAGIGFVGTGAIIRTSDSRIRGLTTAAGLWAAAIVGLSLGAGFFEGGLLVTVIILIVELALAPLEHKLMHEDKMGNPLPPKEK